jgi:hypothetical protein
LQLSIREPGRGFDASENSCALIDRDDGSVLGDEDMEPKGPVKGVGGPADMADLRVWDPETLPWISETDPGTPLEFHKG